MKNELISIIGAGGHARSIYSWLMESGESYNIQFIDKHKNNDSETIFNHEIICSVWNNVGNIESDVFLLGIGDNDFRRRLYQDLVSKNKRVKGVIHPTSIIGKGATIHDTTNVGPLCIVGPLAEVGENTILNSGCIIEHETKIGKHCHIAPGAKIAGRVKIGNNVLVGIGAIIKENIAIEDDVVIGAGAVVINNVKKNDIVVGVPAKSIKRK